MGSPGLAGVGGVIRDDCGQLCASYSVFSGQHSNNLAEMRSLLEGAQRCYQLGFYRVEIETDSQIFINWIVKGNCNIWYLEDFWDALHGYLVSIEYRARHIFLEGNVIADFLAKQVLTWIGMVMAIWFPANYEVFSTWINSVSLIYGYRSVNFSGCKGLTLDWFGDQVSLISKLRVFLCLDIIGLTYLRFSSSSIF